MVVYIECVIVNNLVINLVILYMTALLTGRRIIWWQAVIAACIGAGYALISPMVKFVGSFVVKILLSWLMCLVSSRFNSLLDYAKYTAIFYIITFTLGGSIIGISNISTTVHNAIYDPNNISVALVLVVVVALLIGIKCVLRHKNLARNKNSIAKVSLKIDGVDKALPGYLDTGNTLYYKGLYPVVALVDVCGLKARGKIKVKTINNCEVMDVYPIDRLSVNGKEYKNVYAIKQNNKSEYGIILHSCMI